MTKSKNLFKIVTLACILLACSILLLACGKKKEEPREYISNGNGMVITETIDGKTAYRAVADKWYEFVGWYDGQKKYSEKELLIINKNTPTNMQAHFQTSAKSTFNRHLESFYNSYAVVDNQQGQYLNFNMTNDLNYSGSNETSTKDINIGGYIDFDNSSQFSFQLTTKNNTDFALYYVDNGENGEIYIQIGENKYSFSDIGLFTNIFTSLKSLSTEKWSMDSLVTDSNKQYLINQYFGIKNSMGFIDEVSNSEDSSTITLSYHRILNYLKNAASSSNNATPLQNLIHALTCEYEYSTLPEMILTITTNFEVRDNKEYVKDIEVKFNLDKDYTLNFGGEKITLSQIDFDFKIDSYHFGISNQANAISTEILDSFPEPTVNMINVHADGELNFLSVSDVVTVVDKYIIELDTDLNPMALVSFKKDRENNYNDIEWEKLGYLNLRISLVPESDEKALKAQQDRHNEWDSTYRDYINILIDTKNNGANVYFYLGLYSPVTLFTSNYIYNHSFNIPSLINMLASGEGEVQDTQLSPNLILTAITSTIKAGLEIQRGEDPNVVVKDLFVKFLKFFGLDSTIVENNIALKDNGLEMSLPEIRTEIRDYEKQTLKKLLGLTGALLGNTEIKLDKKLFGDDETDKITHLEISMNKPELNTVVKNDNGQYLTEDGKLSIDVFNEAHPVLTKIKGLKVFEKPLTVAEVLALKGTKVLASEGILSSGKIVSTFKNNKGEEKPLELIVEDVELLSKDENTASVRMLLQFKDYPNSISSIPLIGEEIYNLIGLPYGLIIFETTIQIS